jgi:DnaJ-class molecular chaperone
MRRDYYAVLGIGATASAADIKRAYRRLARRYSPDINLWDAEARPLFEEIAEAYRILSDPESRAAYDRFGRVVADPGSLPPGRRGDDLYVSVALSFAEAARGTTVALPLRRFSPCPGCGGRGCSECARRGLQLGTDSVPVRVPAGVDTGSEVRVPGEGHAGPFGGPRGDLLVATRVSDHPFFTRKGDNLYCEVSITVLEAILGGRLDVPTLEGESSLTLPPGVQSGQVFRLRGHGVPRRGGTGTGDLYVSVRVVIPAGLDVGAEALVRELSRFLPPNPRPDLRRYREGRS